ncbi:hypothetical protein EBT25_16835, partial [bacterium]|nr:hypothetical protein [bacterium]
LVHSEPYDEAIALEALNWLAAIRTLTEAPAPERHESYCQSYCKFYDASGEMGCVGIKKEHINSELPQLDDSEAAMDALHYTQVDEQIKVLENKKAGLRSKLEGKIGITETGLEIRWSSIQSNTVDKDAVEKALGYVPMKQGKESTRLSIKKIGGK